MGIAPSCLANSSVINMPIAQMSTPMTPSVPNLNSLSNLMLKQQPGSNHFVSIPNANQFQQPMPPQQMMQTMGVQVVQPQMQATGSQNTQTQNTVSRTPISSCEEKH